MIAGLALLLFGAAPPAAPIPPPVDQAVANCDSPIYASDVTVCSNEILLALDRELGALLPIPEVASSIAFEEQDDWFRRSRKCAFRPDQVNCLRAAYRERLAVAVALRAFANHPLQWREITCGKSAVQIANVSPGVVAVRWENGSVLALSATELASWTPYAWTRIKGKKFEVRGPNGVALRCPAPVTP